MKKGPVILIIAGLALLTFLFFLPLTPSGSPGEEKIQNEGGAETTNSTPGETSSDGLSPDERVEQALTKLQSGELQPMQAILTIREIAEEHPDNVKANFTMGAMAVKTGQFERAIHWFENVLKTDPDNAEALRMTGMSYLNTGDTARAVEYYEQALEHSSGEAKEVIREEMNSIK